MRKKERKGKGWMDGRGGLGNVHGYREEKKGKMGKRKEDVLNNLTHAR